MPRPIRQRTFWLTVGFTLIVASAAVLIYAKSQGPNYICVPLGDPAFNCSYWKYVSYMLGFPLVALASLLPAVLIVAMLFMGAKRLRRK